MKYTDKPKFIVDSILEGSGPLNKKTKAFAKKSKIFEIKDGKLVTRRKP